MDTLFSSKQYEDKFEYISGRILEQQNMYYENFQRIFNKDGVKISEMRFFPGGDNCRIYCKEQTIKGNQYCIIMAKLLPKKSSQKINKAIQQLIDSIKNYDYELEE